MSKKLLIVDDDLYLRDLYKEILTDAGYEVETANDGREGLDKLNNGGYDLTLLDVMMPHMDGLGVLTKLHETPPTAPNGPVVLLTNLAHDPVIKEALSKGAASYLIKADLTPDQVVEKVKEYLK
jgi:CheY-like chemotaxis protein